MTLSEKFLLGFFVVAMLFAIVAILWIYLPYDVGTNNAILDSGGDRTYNDTYDYNGTSSQYENSMTSYGNENGFMTERNLPSGSNVSVNWFREVSSSIGLSDGGSREEYSRQFVESRLPGVYISDFNKDGYSDFLTVGASGTYLYRNDKARYERVDDFPNINVTVSAAIFFDYDNDGWEDLYLLSDEGSVFLENNQGDFRREEVGLEKKYESSRGVSVADYTKNGCLDVFVVQANDWRDNRPEGYSSQNVSIEEDNGNPNRLFAGNCSSFKETTNRSGIQGKAWSLATSFVDFTNDGYPDIHVANDFNNDVLYINQRDGTFERRVLPGTNRNGMSSEVADVNGDSLPDVFVTNIYYGENQSKDQSLASVRYGGRTKGNQLLLNQGNGTFVDVADQYGVRRGGWGWGALLKDFNNDGVLDLYHSEYAAEVGNTYPNIWKGIRHNESFERLNSSQVGFKKSEEVGVASLDYNNDGNLDIITSNSAQEIFIYENVLDKNRSLQIVLSDKKAPELGAVVRLKLGGTGKKRIVSSESDYRSQSDKILHFGLNNHETANISVEWTDGNTTEIRGIETNQRVKISRQGVVDSISLHD